jgi:hypothetical protein
MAQFLYERHSFNVHLRTVKRHIRLGRQVKGAQELVTAIEPFYTDLVQKTTNANLLSEETEFKRDSLSLVDANLDDKVRDLFEASKKYDRDHPGLVVTPILFPAGTSPIVYAPIETEPSVVEKLILAVQNLGEGHALAEHIPILQAAIDETKTAIAELHVAISAEKTADALATISKLNLNRQYAQNIHAASAKFGKDYANRLFPAIKSTPKADDTEEMNSEAK